MRLIPTLFAAVALGLSGLALTGQTAEAEPLHIVIDQGVIEPMPFAVPDFLGDGKAGKVGHDIARVVAADLAGTGLFREIPADAFISKVTSFDAAPAFSDWQAINTQALITGEVAVTGDKMVVKFRLYDIVSGQAQGDGLQFAGPVGSWRRIAHKVADAVYSRITGEGGYFDSRVVFVSETGPKTQRIKKLAVMDYDGANVSYLTDGSSIVLAPRFSPKGDKILFTSYASGFPHIYLMNTADLSTQILDDQPGTMTFSPRFSPDGGSVAFSLERDGNTDIYLLSIGSGKLTQLTNSPSIETAPSFSPDGSQIVFESDRSGQPQLYVMPTSGGEPTRISSGKGKYDTPVWSPRGDLIAFTNQTGGAFHIGVMRADGSDERLLTSSFLDEGPTWAPNGRVVMFTRETAGADGSAALYSIDITGHAPSKVMTETAASDPAWSPLLP
jgi:TolB protein